MRRTLITVIIGIMLIAANGCFTPPLKQRTPWRTLRVIEADPASYNGMIISFMGTVRDVAVNPRGMNLLVATGVNDDQYFRVQSSGPPPHPTIVRGDTVMVLGRVRQTAGVVGLGDRLTRTVQVDTIALSGPEGGHRLLMESELVDRWQSGLHVLDEWRPRFSTEPYMAMITANPTEHIGELVAINGTMLEAEVVGDRVYMSVESSKQVYALRFQFSVPHKDRQPEVFTTLVGQRVGALGRVDLDSSGHPVLDISTLIGPNHNMGASQSTALRLADRWLRGVHLLDGESYPSEEVWLSD